MDFLNAMITSFVTSKIPNTILPVSKREVVSLFRGGFIVQETKKNFFNFFNLSFFITRDFGTKHTDSKELEFILA